MSPLSFPVCRRLLRGLIRIIAATMFVMFAGGAPASAHSASNSPSSNYVSTLGSVAPATNRFSAKVIEAGSRIEIRWRSGGPLVVQGYDGEPYLRISKDGLQENRLSSAVYVNADRNGAGTIPADVDSEAPAAWKTVSPQPVARFHDHRIHWMGSSPPPVVDGAPGDRHRIQDWTITVQDGEAVDAPAFTVAGTLDWVPGPSPVVSYLGAAVVGLTLVALALWAGRSVARRALVRLPVMVAMLALVAVDALHLYGIAGGIEGGSLLSRFLGIGWSSIAAWAMSLVAVVLLARGREDSLYLMTFAAGIITLVGGLADLSVLSHSAVAFAFSPGLSRFLVAATLGLGVGIAVAAVLLTRPVQTGADAPVVVTSP